MAGRYDKTTYSYLFGLERMKLSRKTCAACGDPTGSMKARMRSLLAAGDWPHAAEWLFCRECADEKFRRQLCDEPARLFTSGGGRSVRPNIDDTGPWGENAIRILEDG
jgi:hypothetical protein